MDSRLYEFPSPTVHQVNVFGDEERHDALPLSADDSRFCIFSVRFSNDGNEILGSANDGFIYLFDRESQQQSLRYFSTEF